MKTRTSTIQERQFNHVSLFHRTEKTRINVFAGLVDRERELSSFYDEKEEKFKKRLRFKNIDSPFLFYLENTALYTAVEDLFAQNDSAEKAESEKSKAVVEAEPKESKAAVEAESKESKATVEAESKESKATVEAKPKESKVAVENIRENVVARFLLVVVGLVDAAISIPEVICNVVASFFSGLDVELKKRQDEASEREDKASQREDEASEKTINRWFILRCFTTLPLKILIAAPLFFVGNIFSNIKGIVDAVLNVIVAPFSSRDGIGRFGKAIASAFENLLELIPTILVLVAVATFYATPGLQAAGAFIATAGQTFISTFVSSATVATGLLFAAGASLMGSIGQLLSHGFSRLKQKLEPYCVTSSVAESFMESAAVDKSRPSLLPENEEKSELEEEQTANTEAQKLRKKISTAFMTQKMVSKQTDLLPPPQEADSKIDQEWDYDGTKVLIGGKIEINQECEHFFNKTAKKAPAPVSVTEQIG